VSMDNNRVNFVYEGSRSSAARVAVRKVLPPFSTLVDPDGIEEELAHKVRLSSTDPYPVSQLSEQNRSATNDVKSGDDLAELGSVSDDNSVRDSHDDPQSLDVNDDQCYALPRMRPLSNSWAECSVVISCGKVDYDKSG
jgi:hypothetical protein